MKIKKYKKSEKGFVIVLAILLLLVMSLMGTTLIVIASNDHKGNKLRDYNQQTFYAAETGIQEAKEYLNQQVQKGVKLKPYDIGPLNFCKTAFFPNLSSNMNYVKAIGPENGSARKGWASMSHLGSSDETEKKRLKNDLGSYFVRGSAFMGKGPAKVAPVFTDSAAFGCFSSMKSITGELKIILPRVVSSKIVCTILRFFFKISLASEPLPMV